MSTDLISRCVLNDVSYDGGFYLVFLTRNLVFIHFIFCMNRQCEMTLENDNIAKFVLRDALILSLKASSRRIWITLA